MNVFVFVINVRQTESVKMNIIIAAILLYYNIYNPGPLEQEPDGNRISLFFSMNFSVLVKTAGI